MFLDMVFIVINIVMGLFLDIYLQYKRAHRCALKLIVFADLRPTDVILICYSCTFTPG